MNSVNIAIHFEQLLTGSIAHIRTTATTVDSSEAAGFLLYFTSTLDDFVMLH